MNRALLAITLILLLQGCGVTYRLTKTDSPEPKVGTHEIAPSYSLQYMSCDHRSWFASNGPRPSLNPADEKPSASSMLVQTPENIAAAKQAFPFALMSSNVYRDDDKYFALPGWTLFKREDSPSGLTVDVWTQGAKENPDRVAVVFRGTDGFNLDDWRANLSIWLEPEQYFEAQRFFKEQILTEKRFERSDIVVAGHSLGGGIAINVSLRWSTSARPVAAYAFNSSPRGFYRPYDDSSTAARVILSENAEVLSFFRKLWWRKIKSLEERKYNFVSFRNLMHTPIGEHRIYPLSRALLMLAVAHEAPNARDTFRANFDMKAIEEGLKRRGLSEAQVSSELALCRVHLN